MNSNETRTLLMYYAYLNTLFKYDKCIVPSLVSFFSTLEISGFPTCPPPGDIIVNFVCMCFFQLFLLLPRSVAGLFKKNSPLQKEEIILFSSIPSTNSKSPPLTPPCDLPHNRSGLGLVFTVNRIQARSEN
jgi:hypothetical protein